MNVVSPMDVFDCPLDGINLIEASAGTGKTWAICGLYVRLLLEREFTVREILVVTFTKAATAELRERIRARIRELRDSLAQEPGAPHDPFITRLTAAIDQAGRRRASIELLHRALESFDEASIFTIHGFCQRALADNPFSAGLPMHMELVEDDHELLMEAVNDYWRRHVAGETVTPGLALYLTARGDSPDKLAKLLERHLAKPLAQLLWPADIESPLIDADPLTDLYRQVRESWLAQRSAIVDRLRASLGALKGQTYKDASVQEGAGEWDRIVREDQPFAIVESSIANVQCKARLYRAGVLEDNKKKNGIPPVHAFFDHAEAYLSMRERLDASFSLARLRLIRGLLQEAGAQLRDLKLSRQVISFNDMLSNVHERLMHSGHAGLAASIEQRFPAALIDEFQDTDPLQFDIFRRIYAGGDSHVFVVGDPKQAIYSFRNADLHTYLRAAGWATNRWSLAANQRSSKPLLTAINGLFEENPGAFILKDVDYHHVSFGDKRRSLWVDETEPRAPLQLWTLPQGAGGPLPKAEARRAAVRATAAEIARLVQAGSLGQVTLDGQPLRPRDIAVLVRSRALGSEVKRALAALRVGAVEIGRNSVFHAAEAQDLETVLTAILSPSREPLLRAALATDLLGCTVSEIEAISGDEARLMDRVRQFTEYRELWFQKGFGLMYRRILADQAVAERLLSRPDGERRLTNFLHLGELLHQAAQTHAAPEALWRHLKSARDDDDAGDAVQLRLESDQNLVQIVTIHACKGLEYPVVFCPFVCDGRTRFGGPSLQGLEYHDARLEPVIDFRQWAKGDPERVRIEGILRSEQAAETVRLVYVALTRAVHRCYLVTGTYSANRSLKESARSMLNWLVAGRDMDLNTWFENGLGPADIDAAWQRFAQTHAASVGRSPLPPDAGRPLVEEIPHTALESNLGAVVAAGGWRLSSYSGLNFGAKGEQAANDRDARVVTAPGGAKLPAGLPEDDILRFPRGASAGECIHAVFENIDFTDESTWDPGIAAALERHPQARPGDSTPEPAARLAGMLRNLIRDVTTATLMEGLQLRSVALSRRLTELEFTFPVPHLPAAELNDALQEFGYDMHALRFGSLEGYLKGFIDLVFEHQGRYFILDWKSNHLGYEPADYGPAPLARAMTDHGYHLQYLLYTVALDRYLRRRLPAYRYEQQFGGVLYLFVRGVRAAWPGTGTARPGVFYHRPTGAAIQRLNAILDQPARRAAL